MANPFGRIDATTQIKCYESVEQVSGKLSSKWVDVYIPTTLAFNSSFVHRTGSIEYEDTGTTHDGYFNGTPYYMPVTTSSVATISGLTNVEFVYFKHTGFRYNLFTDATVDLDDTAGSGSTYGSNPKIIRMDSTVNVREGMTVSSALAGIASGSVVTQIDSATNFRVDLDTVADRTNVTCTFTDHSAPSTTANTVDALEIRGGAADGFVIAVLQAGNGIALPVQSSSGWGTSGDRVDSGDYFFQSVSPANIDTAGGNNIAMEFICVTAS